MKTLSILLLLAATPLVSAASGSHCKVGETTYFNCTIKGGSKVVSLCGKHVDKAGSYLQYRFGLSPGETSLVYPPTKDDAAMGEAFYFNRGGTPDSSVQSEGVWFEHANTYYELKHTVYIGPSGQVATRESQILMWAGVPAGAPRPLVCQEPDGGARLEQASALIESMSPRGRSWKMSPLDVHYKLREQQQAAERAADESVEESAAKSVDKEATKEVESAVGNAVEKSADEVDKPEAQD